MLVKDLSLSETDNSRWVLKTMDGRHMLLNQASATLVQLLQKHHDYEAAVQAFNLHFNTDLSTETFRQLTKEKLSGLQILTEEENGKVQKKGKYLHLQVPFFSPSVAGALSAPFRFLYSPRLFFVLISILAGVIAWILISYPSQQAFEWTNVNLLLLACLVYPSVLIHELGHIAASRAAGVEHGEVGFAFYLIFPVLYSDVTNIWQVPKKRRIIVNLAGATNELLYAVCLFLIFYFTGNKTLLTAFYLINLKILFELNPFVRMDGYWVFSDITNTPNLLPKANKLVKDVFGAVFSRSKHLPAAFSRTDKWLIIYGMANTAFILIYMGFMLVSHFDSIIHFPAILLDLFMKMIRMELSFNNLKSEYLFVFIFYWLVGRMLYHFILKNSRVTSAKLGRVAY
ncbi:hypothetical protein HQN86_14875 [Pedobacter panaciterrae]|uniref:site-2 protease family protein n=1 Tax=Pedobacter panaciterrae TaxID=363849 RepID=UPI00155DA72D|nr:site-2 protease family protein [Pedobacter panaciterrae]NQX54903.1 hypothetical protein [Pedobacter panaciterrae]